MLEWPAFAAFVVFFWFQELRRELRSSGSKETVAPPAVAQPDPMTPQTPQPSEQGPPSSPSGIRRPVRVARRVTVPVEADDGELAAYNRYLEWLNANPDARPGDYPG